MLAPIVAQHQPLIRDYITETLLVCLADPNYTQASGGDALYGAVTLLLNGDADFNDRSTLGIVPTTQGSPTISAAQSVFGGSSMYFPTTGAPCKIYSNNPGLSFQGDWTLEFRMRVEAHNGSGTYMMGRTGNATRFFYFNSSGGAATFQGGGGSVSFTGVTFAINTWYAIAITRSGSTMRCFVDGVLKGTNAVTSDESSAGAGFGVLRLSEGGNNDGFNGTCFHGWLDEVRFTKGVARYTADYTVAAQAFANTSPTAATVLSMHFDGADGATTTTDSSAYGRAITRVAPATLSSALKKFGSASGVPGAAGYWSAANAPELQMLTGDFTAEAWINVGSFISGDPDWGKVLLLLDNSGPITKDSSIYNRTVVASNGATLSTPQQFGRNTYQLPYGGKIEIANDRFLSEGNHAEEWCIEFWLYPTGATPAGNLMSFGGGSVYYMQRYADGSLNANCSSINGSSYGLGTSVGATPLNQWTHVAFVRDNTSNASWGYLHLYINGVRNGTSAAFGKADTVNDNSVGFAMFMGYFGSGASHNRSNMRITKGTARYYGTFTPPAANFGVVADRVNIIAQDDGLPKAGRWGLRIGAASDSPARRLQFAVNDVTVVQSSTDLPLGSWVHVAVARQSGTVRLFQNGALVGSAANSSSLTASSGISVGGGIGSLGCIQGNIDEARLVKGAAIYTGAFAAPTYRYCDSLTGTNSPVDSPDDTPIPSGLRFQTVTVDCLDATESAALGSTVIVNFDTDSTSPEATYAGVPPGLTPTLTWIGPLTGTLALAGTPTTPGVYNFVATFFENNSNKMLGTAECDITVWPAAGTFSPGAMNNPTGRVGVPATLQLTAPSANYNVDISVVANLPVPGMDLTTVWTPGVTSSGTVSLVGTPTAAGAYNLTVTYRRKSTCEVRNLATSTHTVTIGALAAPPAPAPAPAPAPSPAPAPAPTPPGISSGPVPDNLWSSVAILQQWNNSRIIQYELGDSRVDTSILYMDARGRHEMTEPSPFSSTEGAGDAGSAGGISLCYVGDSLWQTDGNLTAECFFRLSAADVAYLFGSSTETRLLVMMSLNSTAGTGNFMWKLGYSSSIEGGRRVVRPTFIQGRVGGPVGSSPIQCFGPEISTPPFAFFHLAGQVVLSGGTTEIAAWHNGVGGGATKVVTSGQSYRLVSGNTFKTHEGSKPNCAPTGGLTYSGTRAASGFIDQMRVTKAQRYTATAGVTNAISRDKITPPFAAS